MSTSFRFYLLSDIDQSPTAVIRELERAGLRPDGYRPENKADFLANLTTHKPAVIILWAAQVFHFEQVQDWLAAEETAVPIWMIVAPEDEATAVNAMYNGMDDYFFTDRLSRLGPAAAQLVGQSREFPEPVNLNKIMDGILAEYQPLFEARGLELTFLPAVDLPSISGDPVALAEAMSAVMRNIIEAAPAETKTSVRPYLDAVKGEVCLEIRLSGQGLETEEQIAETAVSEASLKTPVEIVEAQNGRVDLSSGADFGIRICAAFPAILKEQVVGSPNLLIVENSLLMRSILQEALEQEGFTVQTAEHGADALEKMGGFHPDLIISDIRMPTMDGFDFFEAVREKPEWQEIPFIFVTGQSDQKEHLNTQVLRGATYLIKPIIVEELLVAVRSRLPSHEMTPKKTADPPENRL